VATPPTLAVSSPACSPGSSPRSHSASWS